MDTMLLHTTYTIFMLNIDPALFINMDESLLMWVPSSQCIWGDKGAKIKQLLV